MQLAAAGRIGATMSAILFGHFLPPYMGVIPNHKMAFIFPISCILALIFPVFMKYFPKCSGKGSFPKSQIKSLNVHFHCLFEGKMSIAH